MDFKIVLKGNKEIGLAAGINPDRVGYYIDHHGFPAFKIKDSTTKTRWLAFPDDVKKWLEDQRDSFVTK